MPNVLIELSQFVLLLIDLTRDHTYDSNPLGFVFPPLILAVYLFITYMLLLKPDWVIDKLKLDKHFKQEIIPFNVHRTTILSIAIIVMGGLIIIDSIPLFCKQFILFFQYRQGLRNSINAKPFDYSYIIIYGVKTVIGLVLVGNQRMLVNYIEYKRRNRNG